MQATIEINYKFLHEKIFEIQDPHLKEDTVHIFQHKYFEQNVICIQFHSKDLFLAVSRLSDLPIRRLQT